MVGEPAQQIRISNQGEMIRGLRHVAQQQIETTEQRHRVQLNRRQPLQLIAGLLDQLRLASRETCRRESQHREESGFARTVGLPSAEQIDLLLNGEETADLLEERFEVGLGHRRALTHRRSAAGRQLTLQPPAITHQTVQQGDALIVIGDGTEVPAQQIQDPEGEQCLQLLLEHGLLIGQFPHALLQLDAIPQHLRRRFITPLLLFGVRSSPAGQCGHQGEISFTTTPKGRSLRRLQPLARQLEGLLSGAGLPEQNQPGHLTAGGEIQPHGFVGVGLAQAQQGGFVVGPGRGIGQQISGAAQQGFPLHQGFSGESLIGWAVTTALEAPQDRISLGRWTDAQESEVIDGQIHRRVPNGGEL